MTVVPAKFEVLLTTGAEQDLEAIHDYLCEFDCVASANVVLDELTKVVESLSKFPEHGSYPKELLSLGIKEYSQSFFKPYPMIYRVTGRQVIVYLMLMGGVISNQSWLAECSVLDAPALRASTRKLGRPVETGSTTAIAREPKLGPLLLRRNDNLLANSSDLRNVARTQSLLAISNHRFYRFHI